MHQLGEGIRESAGAHVVDALDGVVGPHGPATIDHFLAAALHLGVGALDGGEVELGGLGACRHRRCRAAPESDEHCRTAEGDQHRTDRQLVLVDVIRSNRTVPTGDHDGLVVPPTLCAFRTLDVLMEGTEVSSEVGSPELIVEGRRTDGPLDHDLLWRGQALRVRAAVFPGQWVGGELQIGDREATQASLGLPAASRGALIPDLTAGARGCAWMGRDPRRVVVGLDLDGDVNGLGGRTVDTIRGPREEASSRLSGDDGGVVRVGAQDATGTHRVGVANHLEQASGLIDAIDGPARVEDLVSAVLRVGLREHEQLDVRRIAAELAVIRRQVVDLIVAQRQSEAHVGLCQRLGRVISEGHSAHRRGISGIEEGRSLGD